MSIPALLSQVFLEKNMFPTLCHHCSWWISAKPTLPSTVEGQNESQHPGRSQVNKTLTDHSNCTPTTFPKRLWWRKVGLRVRRPSFSTPTIVRSGCHASKHLFLQFWNLESPRSRYQEIWCLVRTHRLTCRLLPSHHVFMKKMRSWFIFFLKYTNPIMRA